MNSSKLLAGLSIGIIVGLCAVVLLPEPPESAIEPALHRPRTVKGASDSPPGFRVVGVMVNAPVHTGGEFEELAFFGTFGRTRVAIELSYPDGGIIDLDGESSQLAVFRDDTGTELRKLDDPFGPFEMMPRIAEDGRHMVFVADSESLPAAGAGRLTLQGTVAVLVARDKDRFEADVEFRAGEAFATGPFEFEVKEVGPSGWDDGWTVTLETPRDVASIVGYSVVTDTGRELELSPMMTMNGMGSWTQTLHAEEELRGGRLRVECWRDPERVEVPFEVSTGLGLR